jgi:hypothetical protein
MNLSQQFPHIPEQTPVKKGMKGKNYATMSVAQTLGYTQDRRIAKYYERAFRRRHIKLMCIIAVIFAVLYFIAYKSVWIYNVMNI